MAVVSLVVAMDLNRVIGRDNALPWRLPADLRHFRDLTMGKPIIMGRNTFESIGRPLPGRTNVVVTRNPDYHAADCVVVNSLDDALDRFADCPELMVIGGASIYAQALPGATRIHLTLIHHAFDGDTYFPEVTASEWMETGREDRCADDRNPYDYSFIVLERKT